MYYLPRYKSVTNALQKCRFYNFFIFLTCFSLFGNAFLTPSVVKRFHKSHDRQGLRCLHKSHWGISHAKPIGSSNCTSLAVGALPPQMWQQLNPSRPQRGEYYLTPLFARINKLCKAKAFLELPPLVVFRIQKIALTVITFTVKAIFIYIFAPRINFKVSRRFPLPSCIASYIRHRTPAYPFQDR